MGSEDAEVYIMQEGEGDWVNPTPARSLILEALEDESDVDGDDLDDLGEYVDWEDLREVLAGDDAEATFEIEDVTVSVDEDGDIEIE